MAYGVLRMGRGLMRGAAGAAGAAANTQRASFLKKYYDGGFESPMTKREAALILGIR